MSNMVTRCPKCATSFRITSAQLQSAKGAVRCGSCLHIFKAHDHLVSSTTVDAPLSEAVAQTASAPAREKPATSKSSTATKPTAAASQPAKTSTQPVIQAPQKTAEKSVPPKTPAPDALIFSQELIDEELAALGDDEDIFIGDDILISDDMHQSNNKEPSDTDYSSGYSSNYSSDAFLEIDERAKPSMSLFERSAREEHVTEEDGADESWAENLLDEADEETRFDAIKQRINTAENTDDGALPESFSTQFERADAETPAYGGHIFSLINDETSDDQKFKAMFTEEELGEEDLSEELRAIPRDPPTAAPEASAAPIRAYDTSRAALLMNIMPEPVVMTKRNKRKWQRKKLWVRLSILMIVVLLAQVAWLQFDTLSRISPYRSGYEVICPILGCQVPTLVDKSKIRVRNLLVRKHPDIAGALIVDVIVLNNAAHAQPFPDLLMAFTDIDEQPVAARRFTPREYLRGELAGYNLMPQNQPVHISLELVDPGEEAVNYKIEPY